MNPSATQSSPPTLPKRPRVLLTLLAVALLPVLMLGAWRAWMYRAVEVERAGLLARGEPTRLRDFAAVYPPVPDSANAVNLLVAAWKDLAPEVWNGDFDPFVADSSRRKGAWRDHRPPRYSRQQLLPPADQPLPPEWVNELRAYVTRFRDATERLHEAARRPVARFPLAFSESYRMRLPHLASFKSSAQLLAGEAVLAAAEQDPARASRALAALAGLSRLMQDEPTLVGQMVHVSLIGLLRNATENVLNRVALPPAALQEVSAAWRQVSTQGCLRRALQLERVAGLRLFQAESDSALETESTDDDADAEPTATGDANLHSLLRLTRVTGLAALDERFFLEYTRELIALETFPWPARLEAATGLQSRFTSKGFFFRLGHVVSTMTLPAASRSVDRFAQAEAQRSLVLAALALEFYRREHPGELPAALTDLIPRHLDAVPIDPFDGRPIRYVTNAGSYRLYSLGPDRRDQGGVPAIGVWSAENPSDETLSVGPWPR